MTRGPHEQRAYNQLAAHHRYRDEYTKAFKVLRRFPVYTLFGASRHHILNGDMFEKDSKQPSGDGAFGDRDALAAKKYQDAERREEMQVMVDEAMGASE